MKTSESKEVEKETIKDPKGAERFTAHLKKVDGYDFGEVYAFGEHSYRLIAMMNYGDGVALEFVKVQ